LIDLYGPFIDLGSTRAVGCSGSLGETAMSKFLSIVAALGFLVVSAPAFAQKKSCQEVCLQNFCASATSKNWCMQKCVANCNMKRSSKS
jgi:hypothetical protein